MNELERRLHGLRDDVAFPATPDLARAVRVVIEPARQPPRVGRLRRVLVPALAVLVLALAGALAVPSARTAILELFRLGGVSIQRVDALPPVRPGLELELGAKVDLEDARDRAGFSVRRPSPEVFGEPDAVFFSPDIPGGRVSLLYGTERDVRLLVTEFRGTTTSGLITKLAGAGTRIEGVTIGESRGLWLEGRPHAVLFRDARGDIREDRYRLAANVLIWAERGVTYRLEGRFSRDEALSIASSMRSDDG